jgi:hypothetical protein
VTATIKSAGTKYWTDDPGVTTSGGCRILQRQKVLHYREFAGLRTSGVARGTECRQLARDPVIHDVRDCDRDGTDTRI